MLLLEVKPTIDNTYLISSSAIAGSMVSPIVSRMGGLKQAIMAALALAATCHAACAAETIVSSLTFPGTITDDQWKVFQDNVAREADPPLQLKMLIRGEIGAEEVAVNATRRGRLQITGASMSAVSQVAPATCGCSAMGCWCKPGRATS